MKGILKMNKELEELKNKLGLTEDAEIGEETLAEDGKGEDEDE